MKLRSALYSNLIGHAVDLPLNSVIQESADYGAYVIITSSVHPLHLEKDLTRACLPNTVPFMCNLRRCRCLY
jgi:hypothetical protein